MTAHTGQPLSPAPMCAARSRERAVTPSFVSLVTGSKSSLSVFGWKSPVPCLSLWRKDAGKQSAGTSVSKHGPSVQFSGSVMSNSATPWTAARQASLSITNSRSLFKLRPTESVLPSSHLILCCPLLLLPQSFPA